MVRLKNHDGNLFHYLDANSDKRLTPIELAQLRNLPLSESGQLPPMLQLEFGAAEVAMWGGVRIPAPLRPKGEEPGKQPTPAWFQAQDRNGDQIISPREFLGPAETFRQLDQNADALIDPTESIQR